jgi:hypothetical protein
MTKKTGAARALQRMQTRAAPFPGRTLFWRELYAPTFIIVDLQVFELLPGQDHQSRADHTAEALLQWSCQLLIVVFEVEIAESHLCHRVPGT